MPEINLLPWREERRKELKQEFFVVLAGVAVLGAVTVGVASFAANVYIEQQRGRNAFYQKHINDLEQQVAEIKDLKRRRADMLERMRIIQSLQGNRPVITRVFNELVETLPDGVFFNELSLKGKVLAIKGTAESNNRVSSLMRKLDRSEWFQNPNLTQVKANTAAGSQASDFSMSVVLKLPVEEVVTQNRKKKKRRSRG